MDKHLRPDRKVQALQEHGTLNPHPERVYAEGFGEGDFFDARDLLQVKYEMLRRVRLDGQSVCQAAEAFGFSRPAFYQAQASFEALGVPGLLPQRRGPKGRHKLTEAVMEFVEHALEENPGLRTPMLSGLVQEAFGVRVHPRSIERALERRQKKQR